MTKYNEAINIVLQAVGEQTIDETISIDGNYEAEQADTLIERCKEELLTQGWSFNSESGWEFTPDISGIITLPSTVLFVDATSNTTVKKLGNRLYNVTYKTFVFNAPVTCDVYWNYDFDDLPLIAQTYIIARASRIMYQRFVGDTSMLNILKMDEQEAYINLKIYEDEIGDYNIFDDTAVSRALTRTSNPTGIRG